MPGRIIFRTWRSTCFKTNEINRFFIDPTLVGYNAGSPGNHAVFEGRLEFFLHCDKHHHLMAQTNWIPPFCGDNKKSRKLSSRDTSYLRAFISFQTLKHSQILGSLRGRYMRIRRPSFYDPIRHAAFRKWQTEMDRGNATSLRRTSYQVELPASLGLYRPRETFRDVDGCVIGVCRGCSVSKERRWEDTSRPVRK